ncbi:hypothetical protein NC652_016520 [Populus alba x Populus x berolinensis]|nr:hypothetical protein NC652_016520 [Populus alba x Populus x berolinensis]
MPLNTFSPNKFLAQSTSTSHHYSPISHSRSVYYPIRTPQMPQAPAHATTASAPTSQPLSSTTRKTKSQTRLPTSDHGNSNSVVQRALATRPAKSDVGSTSCSSHRSPS